MPDIGVEGAKSNLRATMARTLASALVSGIDQAKEEGHEMSMVQQIDIITMCIMAYHEGIVDAEAALDIEVRLRRRR